MKKQFHRLLLTKRQMEKQAELYAEQFGEDYQEAFDEMIESCQKYNRFILEGSKCNER